MTIVRAKPLSNETPKVNNIVFYNHLSTDELEDLVKRSEIIISRAGYTTLMDLMAVHKNAILIPTPGQTEQEYLANHLQEKNLFAFYSQEQFDLSKAIKAFRKKEWGMFPDLDNDSLVKVIQQLIG
jgi:predicted glycosyltransferase